MITYYTKEGKSTCVYGGDVPFVELHRLDGPAIEYSDGGKEWYKNGKLHRLDGPAIKRKYGHKEWYKNGKLHRLDGPAVIWSDGDEEWWVNDKELNTNEVEAWIKENNINLATKKSQMLFVLNFG